LPCGSAYTNVNNTSCKNAQTRTQRHWSEAKKKTT